MTTGMLWSCWLPVPVAMVSDFWLWTQLPG